MDEGAPQVGWEGDVADATFDFERLRHRPVKYDRELMKKTVRAMDRVAQIKSAREKRFWEKRMEPNEEVQKESDLAEVKQGLDLIVSPQAQQEAQKVTKKASQRAAEKASAGGASSMEQ